jgi:hypothetical protein
MAKFIKLTRGATEVFVNCAKIATIYSQDPVNGLHKPAAALVCFGGSEDADVAVDQTPQQILAMIEGVQP